MGVLGHGGLHLKAPEAAPRPLGRHWKGLVGCPQASAPFLSAGAPTSPGGTGGEGPSPPTLMSHSSML